MLRRLSAGTNSLLSPLFPERRVILRSEAGARYFRLSPLGQCLGVFAVAGLAGWLGYATLTGSETSLRAAAAEARLAAAEDLYESRIAALQARNLRLAKDMSIAEARADAALERLSHKHATLSNAVETERELAAALQTHRSRLDALAGEHDETLKICEASTSRVTALELEILRLERDNASLTEAVAGLSNTVEQVTDERDLALQNETVLTEEVAALSTEIEESAARRERVFSQLEDAASLSLGALEGVFEKSGVKLDPILKAVRREYQGAGGPFLPADEVGAMTGEDGDGARVAPLMSELERLNALRIAVERLPFARPAHAGRYTSGFGNRRDPKNGRRAHHAGLDIAGPRGTPIYATAPGEVVKAGRMRGYGNVIKIRHAFGYETVYAHLHRIRVKVGDVVERGARIGDMGNTGRSTGTHLHYEVRIGGKAVNPAKYIEAARHVL